MDFYHIEKLGGFEIKKDLFRGLLNQGRLSPGSTTLFLTQTKKS
jgi:hypothetical protein